jgi:hypothetical protein
LSLAPKHGDVLGIGNRIVCALLRRVNAQYIFALEAMTPPSRLSSVGNNACPNSSPYSFFARARNSSSFASINLLVIEVQCCANELLNHAVASFRQLIGPIGAQNLILARANASIVNHRGKCAGPAASSKLNEAQYGSVEQRDER